MGRIQSSSHSSKPVYVPRGRERQRRLLHYESLALKSHGSLQVPRSAARKLYPGVLQALFSSTFSRIYSGAGDVWGLIFGGSSNSGSNVSTRQGRGQTKLLTTMTKSSKGDSSIKSWTHNVHNMFSRVKKKLMRKPTSHHSSIISKISLPVVGSPLGGSKTGAGSQLASSNKKRPTMSPPPHEVAAVVPPRLGSREGSRQDNINDSYFMIDRSNMTSSQYTTFTAADDSFCVSLEMKRKHDGSPSGRTKSLRGNYRVDEDNDIVMTTEEDISTAFNTADESTENSLPKRPPASFTTLPPEISLQILQHLPLDSHAALYETNRHFNNLIVCNDDYLYDKQLRIAGSNPRSDSLLSRTIFAFQYSPNSPPDPATELNFTPVEEKWAPHNNIQYLRFLSHHFRVVKKITDQLQSDFYYGFLTSEAGLKMLRLPAHGSHVPEDILVADDMDRDLMHLWEYVNFSAQMMSRDPGQRRYPYGRQQSFYCPLSPTSLPKNIDSVAELSPELLNRANQLPPLNTQHVSADTPAGSQPATPRTPSSRRRRATGIEYPHNSFLTWERKYLRDARNEYWRESAENLSRLESRDMRWVLEVLKAAIVGKALAFLLKEEKPTMQPPQAPSSEQQPASHTNDNAPTNEAPQTVTMPPPILPTIVHSNPSGVSKGESSDCAEMPRFPIFSETDLRAYVGYLIATGGLKLVFEILVASRKLGRSLDGSELDKLLEQWDIKRQRSTPIIATSSTAVSNTSQHDETSNSTECRIERIWERDSKMGGWSNWESWVADFYII